MTIDELEQIYDRAKADQHNSGKRAGIRAVVTALRETFGLAYSEGRMSMVRGGNENHQRQWVDALINEILASDGVEAEPTVGQRLIKAAKEAAAIAKGEVPAAAPDVCEWRIKEYCWETSCGRKPISTPPAGYLNCSCGLPISFKSEAAR